MKARQKKQQDNDVARLSSAAMQTKLLPDVRSMHSPFSKPETAQSISQEEQGRDQGFNFAEMPIFAAGSGVAASPLQRKYTVSLARGQQEGQAPGLQKVTAATVGRQQPVQRSVEEQEEPMQGKLEPVQREEGEEEEPMQGKLEPVQREEGEDEEPMQGKGESDQKVKAIQPKINLAPSGGGKSMPEPVQQKMEGAFGADFSGVRIHEGPQAKAINAIAYTQGSNIHFQPGKYQPDIQSGQELLGHELTHVIQQKAGRVDAPQGKGIPINADSGLEAEADTLGAKAARGEQVLVAGVTTEIQRKYITRKADAEPMQSKHEPVQRQKGKKDQPIYAAKIGKTLEDKKDKVESGVGTVTTTKNEIKRLAGAEVAVQKILNKPEKDIKLGIEIMARAGAFGEEARSKVVEGEGFSYGGEIKQSKFAGAKFESKFSTNSQDVIKGITLLASVESKAGVGADLASKIYAAAGPYKAELSKKLSSFAGILASAKGEINVSLVEGILLSGKAEAKAGAEASGELKGGVTISNYGLTLTGKAEAFAGAKVGAEGKIALSWIGEAVNNNGIALSGKAEAFAGTKTSAKSETGIEYKGKLLIKISGQLEAAAGVGGEIGGTFEYKDGTLKIGAGLALVLGIGGGGGVMLEVNIKDLGKALSDLVSSVFTTKAKINRRGISDDERELLPGDKEGRVDIEEADKIQKALYKAVFPYLEAYAKKKADLVKKGKAEHFVRREKVQNIIDKKILTQDKLKEWVKYKISDMVLVQAAEKAFGEQLELNGIVIQAGIIRHFQAKQPPNSKKPKLFDI